MDAKVDPDSALMLRVKRGDLAAFEQLVDKYKQPILNLIWRTIDDRTEAEDLAQAVFVQAYKAADRYRAAAKFSTWLFTIARNLCLNELRRRSRHPAESMDAARSDEDDELLRQFEDPRVASADAQMMHGELVSKVEEAMAALPETQRTALLLFREEHLSYEDICKVMGCSLAATKSLIHRARETLKARLKPYLRTGVWQEPTK